MALKTFPSKVANAGRTRPAAPTLSDASKRFIQTNESALRKLPIQTVRQVKVMASRTQSPPSPFSTKETISSVLARCFSDNAIITLACVAALTDTAELLRDAFAHEESARLDRLLSVGSLIATGNSADLDKLVEQVVDDGWTSIESSGSPDHQVPSQARRKIARAADVYSEANPQWLELFQLEAPPEPSPAITEATIASAVKDEVTRALCQQEPALQAPEPPPLSMLVTVKSLLSQDIPKRQMVLGTIAERGVVTLIVSPPGLGKTTLGMQLGTAVTAGKAWAGLAVGKPSKVIYYNAEDSHAELARRFAALRTSDQLTSAAEERFLLYFRHGPQRIMDKQTGRPALTQYGKEFRDEIVEAQPALVIVDPLALTHDLDENLNSDMTAYIEILKSIAAEANCAVILMHHTGKDMKIAGMHAGRGASALPASVRSMWQLSETERSDIVVVSCVKSNHFAGREAFALKRDSVSLDNGDEVGLLTPTPLHEVVAKSRSRR